MDGQVTFEWFYDLDGKQVNIGRGQYGTLRIYENGEYVKSVPVDINGHEQFLLDQLLSKSPWLVSVVAIGLIFKREDYSLYLLYIIYFLYDIIYSIKW